MNIEDYEIDITLYKLFYLISQTGSFSKTAELLGVTQPNISYNIKKLEDELGVRLFERGNTIVLTPEGQELLPYVVEAMNSLKRGESKVNDMMNLRKGQISIGVPSHIGVFFLTDIIKKFTDLYPNIKMKVVSKPTKELFRLLNQNELDIVIDSSPLDDNTNNFIISKISKEKSAFACSIENKDLLDRNVELSELSKYNLIVPSRNSGSTKELIEIYKKHNKSFEPSFEISTSDMIAEMVSRNIGIGFLFEKTIYMNSHIRKINMNINLPIFDIYMIYKDYLLSSTTIAFIEFINNKIKTI